MKVNRYIEKTLADFNACTGLAIGGFDHSGNCVEVCVGMKTQCECRFQWVPAVHQAIELLQLTKDLYATVSCPAEYPPADDVQLNELFFTAVYADPNMPSLGVFAFGPYVKEVSCAEYPFKPESALPFLTDLLHRIAQTHINDQKGPDRSRAYAYQVQRAIQYVRQNLDRQVSLEETALFLNVSKCYLCRLFRQETGMTFSVYVNWLRIEHSRSLLSASSCSILDVALASGFGSHSYFCRVFQRLMGMTPQEYRENCGRSMRIFA